MIETWYHMEDGSVGNPREIAPDKSGLLVHKDGRKVAYSEHGPRSRSVDPDEIGRHKEDDQFDRKKTKDMKPVEDEPKAGYKTRESKSK